MRSLKTAALLPLLLGALGAAYQRTPTAPRSAAPSTPSGTSGAAERQAARMTPEQVAAKLRSIDAEEIQAGRLALRKSKDAEIIRYAKLLVRDHTLADKRVRAFARDEKLSGGIAPTDADDAAMTRALEAAAPGPSFDRAFVDAMKTGHDKALAMLSKVKSGTTDMRLRALIDKLAPVIEQHDQLAGKLQAKRLT